MSCSWPRSLSDWRGLSVLGNRPEPIPTSSGLPPLPQPARVNLPAVAAGPACPDQPQPPRLTWLARSRRSSARAGVDGPEAASRQPGVAGAAGDSRRSGGRTRENYQIFLFDQPTGAGPLLGGLSWAVRLPGAVLCFVRGESAPRRASRSRNAVTGCLRGTCGTPARGARFPSLPDVSLG